MGKYGAMSATTAGVKSSSTTKDESKKETKDKSKDSNNIIKILIIVIFFGMLIKYIKTLETSRTTSIFIIFSSFIILGISAKNMKDEKNSKCDWDSEFKNASNCKHIKITKTESDTNYYLLAMFSLILITSIYKVIKFNGNDLLKELQQKK